ncbi:hypothetical protein IUY40_09330 [Flavobacterium sp. ALJ2]|uniref:hypothetical protein n=1 Tax=Flavobacterium sp. ALJ2 TaxID=2786960 RepID=UPI00189CABED|nr:hypothetical protein [Flavobacterium sp. ALJ2]MBF7091743.1 hypothetical protein [Flavobacterium sp. ALJ2]
MKKITFLTSIVCFVLCFTNCKEKTYFKEIVSKKNVGITLAEFPKNKEDLVITIPIEFNLYLNNFSNIWRVDIYYKKNNHLCSEVDDYLIFDSHNDKMFFALDNFKYPNYPEGIYIVERKMKISKEEVLKLIERYNPKTSVENIKSTNDTIPLVSYKKFKEDNPKFIEELRRIPDSITFVIHNKREKKPTHAKARINW